jgi:hypothetical protein
MVWRMRLAHRPSFLWIGNQTAPNSEGHRQGKAESAIAYLGGKTLSPRLSLPALNGGAERRRSTRPER